VGPPNVKGRSQSYCVNKACARLSVTEAMNRAEFPGGKFV
jgi:hypothetical protein